MTPAELLREAANRIERPRYTDDRWLNLLAYGDGADTAPLLAAWLRAEAAHAERRELLDLVGPTAGPDAVAFARSILQEEP